MNPQIYSRWWPGYTVPQFLFWSDWALINAGRRKPYLSPHIPLRVS